MHQASSAGTTKLRYAPDFRRYFAARALSLSGTVVTIIALPVLAYCISGSAALTATVAALEAVPHLLLVAFGVPAVAVFFDGANFGALPVLVGTDRIAEANSIVWSRPGFPDRPCRGTDDDHRGRHPVHGGWRLRRVDGGVVRPGSRHRDAGLALRPDLVVLERGRPGGDVAAAPAAAADLAGSDHAGRPPGLGRVNTAGRMLAWGAGWTGGAALAGLVASAVGVRHAMVLMTTVNLVGVVVAWTSPLRMATASDLPTSESS
ncbi:hypothetical protein BH18ACT8_BH18ACT8_15720 [soil metagenome]